MSKILRNNDDIKKKLSFDDYGMPAQQQTSETVKQQAVLPALKTKVTFYLSDEENDMLMDVYVKRIQEKNKTDKSSLIGEAIKLLFKKEMK